MKGIAVKYALPLLIIIVAIYQFYMVYRHNLTRWKGGGFGMYSEMHPLTREVWIGNKDSIWRATNPKITPKEVPKKANWLRYAPNQKNILTFAALAAEKYKLDSLVVQVWEPYLDPDKNLLGTKLIREVHYAGKP
jgi:hypothetical protein